MFENGRHENHVSGFPPSRRMMGGGVVEKGTEEERVNEPMCSSVCVCMCALAVVECAAVGEQIEIERERKKRVEREGPRRRRGAGREYPTNRRA